MGDNHTTNYVGAQNDSPQDVPLGFGDFFEVKAILALGSRETPTPPFSHIEKDELGTYIKTLSAITFSTYVYGRAKFCLLNICSYHPSINF